MRTVPAFARRAILGLACIVAATCWHAALSDEPPNKSDNPYLARPKSTPEQLLQYLERMRAKPESLRSRPAFADAVIDAADRLASATQDETLLNGALLIKFDTLHERAIADDAAADRALSTIAEEFRDSSLAEVAERARFHVLEQEVLKADKAPADELSPLIAKVKEFFENTVPEERHLRLASATVRLVNRLESDTDAAEAYQQLGSLLAKSSDERVKAYGEKIAKGPNAGKLPEWVGKPMELAGTTLSGDELEWKSYRGKVVLVDFWATWCGPCVASLPKLQETYEAYHDKGFEIIGISVDKDTDTLEKFAEEHSIPWPTVVDKLTDMALARKYGIRAIPATFLVDRDGKIVATDIEGKDLEEHLDKLLQPTDGQGAPDKTDQ